MRFLLRKNPPSQCRVVLPRQRRRRNCSAFARTFHSKMACAILSIGGESSGNRITPAHEPQGSCIVIPITKPVLEEAEAEAAHQVILSGWVSQGTQVAAFERQFAAYCGASYACAVSSCTTALHLALVAVGVGVDDEVITASHSFIATANSIRHCGANPIFVDIDPSSYNIDPDRVAEAITPRTRAILVIHQMGLPCNLPALLEVANRNGITLIEDAACAAGSEIRINGLWEPIGRPRGQIACFSFHPRKVITTGYGGMLTTCNLRLNNHFRLLRQHGMSVSDSVRHGSSKVISENYVVLGYNYQMADIQAAIGLKQLERLPRIIARRRLLARRYTELLGNVEGLGLPTEPEWARSNWQGYCVRLSERVDPEVG